MLKEGRNRGMMKTGKEWKMKEGRRIEGRKEQDGTGRMMKERRKRKTMKKGKEWKVKEGWKEDEGRKEQDGTGRMLTEGRKEGRKDEG
jgi:hypothetical protein